MSIIDQRLTYAAFGLFARSLPKTSNFHELHDFASGIELADSIAGDCHKMLNVVSKSRLYYFVHDTRCL